MSKHGEYVNKLLKKIKKGDHKAFKELYNCTYNHLRVVACRYLRNLGVIEDVMQELYMRVYKYVQNADLEKAGNSESSLLLVILILLHWIFFVWKSYKYFCLLTSRKLPEYIAFG